MNLFEKLFSHQIISRLEHSGTMMITSHERAWLKTMLQHTAAQNAFTPETLGKLQEMLEPEQAMDISLHLIQKAGSLERQVYHPLLRPLRRIIMNKSGIRLSYKVKNGEARTDHRGIPYKLEYSMVKREWYLLWYRSRQRVLMSTRLAKIHELTEGAVSPEAVEAMTKRMGTLLNSRKNHVLIEVVQLYNEELSRILYAFSSFEKQVEYDAEQDIYRITVVVLGDEADYLLSKIRFLGKRVRVIEGDYLKRRMLEAATKALARYQATETESVEELSS